jgi:hypothetical protein
VNRVGFIVSSLLVLLALLSSTLFVVDQRQFGVVYALGQIKDVVTEPGLISSCRRRSRTFRTSTSACWCSTASTPSPCSRLKSSAS